MLHTSPHEGVPSGGVVLWTRRTYSPHLTPRGWPHVDVSAGVPATSATAVPSEKQRRTGSYTIFNGVQVLLFWRSPFAACPEGILGVLFRIRGPYPDRPADQTPSAFMSDDRRQSSRTREKPLCDRQDKTDKTVKAKKQHKQIKKKKTRKKQKNRQKKESNRNNIKFKQQNLRCLGLIFSFV